MSYSRRAVSGLSRIEYRPMKECDWYKLKHKKGEKYIEWDLKFPFRHVKEYETDLYVENEFPFLRDVNYTPDEIMSNYHVQIENGKLYRMCFIHCVFLDGEDSYEYFDTDDRGLERYNYLCNVFNLTLYDNK